jgi:beta-galactosidase
VEVRNIYLESENGLHLHEENQETIVKAHFSPANAKDKELIWSIVDDAGIPLKIATIEEIFKDKKRVKVKVSMFGRETTVDLEFDQIQKI